MRVLTVYYEHRPGGMMKMIYRMLGGCTERGWEMHYLAAAPYQITHSRLHPHLLWAPRNHTSILFWAWFFAAAPFVSLFLAWRERIDLLAVFEGTYAWAVLPARRLLGVPLVVFLQSDVATINRLHRRPTLLRRIEQWMEGASLRHADRIIATNQTLADVVRERWHLPVERFSVLPNNVSTPPRVSSEARRRVAEDLSLPDDAFVVATSGVFSLRKNLDVLLQAFAQLDSPGTHLVVIGAGTDPVSWNEIMRAARERAGGERIHFLGWRADVVQILAGCDLFVFPTLHEGSPLSLIEALRVGLACLGSDIAEIREVLGDDAVCLFDPNDAAALAARIEAVAGNRGAFEELRAIAASRAAIFETDWDAAVAGLMEQAFHGVADTGRGPVGAVAGR